MTLEWLTTHHNSDSEFRVFHEIEIHSSEKYVNFCDIANASLSNLKKKRVDCMILDFECSGVHKAI